MKANDIVVGGLYRAKVNGVLTVVKVDEIVKSYTGNSNEVRSVRYNVTNTKTGRKTTFRSAAKFREPVDTNDALVAGGTKLVGKLVGATGTGFAPTVAQPTGPSATPVPATTSSMTTKPTSTFADAMRNKGNTKPLDTSPHVIVKALAGTGKTTTCIEGLKDLLGLPTRIQPSPQQAAIWESLRLSKGKVSTIGMVAFNAAIAAELKQKVPPGVDAMTAHSLGLRAVKARFKLLPGDRGINKWRVEDLVADLLGKDSRQLKREQPLLQTAVSHLVGLCKMNLLGSVTTEHSVAARLLETSVETVEQMPGYAVSDRLRDGGFDQYADSVLLEIGTYSGAWEDALDALASHYEVELVSEDGRHNVRDAAFQMVPMVLERCLDVERDGCIDFNDMVWLPVALNLPLVAYDVLFVDECQDLNRCTQELACRAGKRLVFVGDENQAIYGFAGADAESMKRLEERLTASDRGCVVLPLTMTRRCGKAIVGEARTIVSGFEAAPTNGEGKVTRLTWESGQYRKDCKPGDMVLCRTNAPLVSECFRFIKLGIKANIQGRDIGKGLKTLVTKLCGGNPSMPVTTFIQSLELWSGEEMAKEQARKRPSESKIIAIDDKFTCLVCFTDNAKTAGDVLAKIDQIFVDDRDTTGILLSSIHKAKGLEAHRVYLLEPAKATVPHPMAKSDWQKGQEMNLRYVAITRAIDELVLVKETLVSQDWDRRNEG